MGINISSKKNSPRRALFCLIIVFTNSREREHHSQHWIQWNTNLL
jgi:hypothetical protein